jgi:hypothetical protein
MIVGPQPQGSSWALLQFSAYLDYEVDAVGRAFVL